MNAINQLLPSNNMTAIDNWIPSINKLRQWFNFWVSKVKI